MKKHCSHYFIILVVCLLAFFQVAFLLESIKWDNLDSYLPVRYFVSECLHYDIFPLWLPYQGLGCPIFGDLISTNYPEAVLLGRLIQYDNIVFQIVFMVYIVLAGTGMYQLSRSLKITAEISLILAVAYAMSGFIVGNAQHIQYIISATWIPFILKYYLQLGSGRKIPVLLKFILFTYLQVSGGYPAHTIFLAYLLAFIFMVRLFRFIQRKDLKKIRSFLGLNFVALIITGVMCFGIFLSIRQSSSDISRYQGMGYDRTILNSFSPQCLISLISPLTPAACPHLFGTDLSMNNLYFGVIVLVLFIYGITRPLTNKSKLFLLTGIISLLLAMGPGFFLHRLAFEFLPLFKTFRHPSNLRLFTIISLLLVTGLQLAQHPVTEDKNLIRFKHILLIFLGFLLLVFVGSASGIILKPKLLDEPDLNIPSLVKAYGFVVPLLLQSLLAFVFTGLLYLFLFVYAKKARMPVFIFLVISEMILYTQLNAPYTVYYRNSDPVSLRNFLHRQPRGFPLPDHHRVAENTDKSVAFQELWVNTNTYAKTVSLDIFYPFVPNGIIRLQEDTALLSGSLAHPLLFMAEKVLPFSQRESYPYNSSSDSKTVFVPDSVFSSRFMKGDMSPLAGDTVFPLQVTPSFIEAEVHSSKERLCLLLQNNYPGWRVFVDDKESVHFSVNHTLIGVLVPPGLHKLSYEFKNPAYIRATLFSFSLFLVILYLVIAITITGSGKTRQNIIAGWIIPAVPLGLLLFFLLKPRVSYAEEQQSVNNEMAGILDSLIARQQESRTLLILNTETPDPFTGVKPSDGYLHQRFRTYADLNTFWNVLDTITVDKLIYAWSNVIEPPEVQEIIRMHFPVVSERSSGDRYAISVYSRGTLDAENLKSFMLNDFECPYPGWTYDRSFLDSSVVFSGRYADKLTPVREFGSTFSYTVERVSAGGIKVFSALRFKRVGDQSCHLVIAVSRKNKSLYYHAVDLDVFYTDETKWNTGFALQQYTKRSLKKGDKIVVYCWNSGKNEALYTDDFRIKIEGSQNAP